MEDNGIYACVLCGAGPLARGGEAYHCPRCRSRFPIRFGVPILLRDVRTEASGLHLPVKVAHAICAATNLPPSAENYHRLGGIFSFNHHLPELHLAAENNYFFNRIPLPPEWKRAPAGAPPDAPVNTEIAYAIDGHLIPDGLPADTEQTRNVRLHNRGASIISSRANPPVCLAYHWRDTQGQVIERDGLRTPLPIDLAPGRTLSLPTVFRTPKRPGVYFLELCLVHEGVGWLEGDAHTVGVEVFPAGKHDRVPEHWQRLNKPQETYNYGEDHAEARRMVLAEIAKRRRADYRILEVGGCCNPMTRGADASIYSIDIDIQTLQVGQLSVRDPAERLQFVAADVHRLPFAPRTFDCIALFSALHHFPHPREVLIGLKRLLRPSGFVAIMCEPVGAYRNGEVSTEFLQELEHGINEQIFSAEEYNHMFLRAGLYTSQVVIDRGSFKAFAHAERPRLARRGLLSKGARWMQRLWKRPLRQTA